MFASKVFPRAAERVMELRHLRYLVVIADTGAFVRAAERLRVAQPALTRQMHDLEKELGAELFESGARRATLTPAGNACVRIARHVLHDTEQCVARARLSNSGLIGRCVIATGPLPIATGLVSAFVARMRSRFPGITIAIVEAGTEDQWRALERAEADIGLGIEPQAPFETLSVAMQYLHAVDCIMVAPSHALASRESVSLADLLDYPMLVLEAGYAPAVERVVAAIEGSMRQGGLPFERLARRDFPSIESVLAHVRAGQGWTPIPSAMAPVLSGIATVKFTEFQAVLPTMRIWRPAESRPVVLTVLDQLKRFQENRGADTPDGGTAMETEREIVPPRLELRHLRSFRSVAEYGSLGRAAEVVGVTQPALSRQMRELEYDVGVALFSRESRGMGITDAGETFRDDISDVLAVVDKIPREIRRAERAQAQRCVVGVVPHPAVQAVVARVLADIDARAERVRIATQPVVSVNQAQALHAADIDIGLGHAFPVAAGPSGREHLVSIPLFHDRISVALVPAGSPLVRESLRCTDLTDVPFVWTTREFHPAFYDRVFAELAAAGLRPRIDAEFDGLNTIWSLVLQGAGWTLGWQSHVQAPPPGLVAVPLVDFDLPWGVVMTYRQDEARVPVLATIDAIVEHASALSGVKAAGSAFPPAHTPWAPIS
jgi:DNA-binding transcriptional LysR family regulator